MAVVVESDLGTKDMTIKAIQRIESMKDKQFAHMLFTFWKKVYLQAVKECPKETGSLTASLRLRSANEVATGPNVVALQGSTNVSGAKDVIKQHYITAGGAGVINPKHKREVHYADAVHNGYQRGAKWYPANPFLTRAWNKSANDFEDFITKYLDWIATEWAKDSPSSPQPGGWFLKIPTGVGMYK